MNGLNTPQPHPEAVGDNDRVMRRVTRTELTLHEDDQSTRPSSSAFLQGGQDGDVSVFLASETTPEHITRNYPGAYVAIVRVDFIRSLGLDVVRDPVDSEPGHCNITGHKTAAKRRAMARSSSWAEGFSPP